MPTNPTPTPRADAATITDAEVARLIREHIARGNVDDDAALLSRYPATADNIRVGFFFALGASRAGAEDLNAVKREAARKAWDAGWDWGTSPVRLRLPDEPRNINDRSAAARDRYLDATYPEARRHVVTLSDGRVFERSSWETRNGKPDQHQTFDIVTNHGNPGRESRHCYATVEELRASARLSWADWQAIDAALAAAVQQEGA